MGTTLRGAAFIFVLSSAASAQTWQDALKKGDYQTAVTLLQPQVIQALLPMSSGDPEPARQLALLYARGLGVPADRVMACGLAQASDRWVEPGAVRETITLPDARARVKESEDFVHKYCDGLSESDRQLAGRTACNTFGMPDEVLALGSEAIRVDRAGIRLASQQGGWFEIPVNCPQIVARVRALTMTPPVDAVAGISPRYFVDVVAWQAAPSLTDATYRYACGWQLFELRGEKLDLVALEQLGESERWPSPALPPDFDARLTIEMIRTGHVHWKIDGAPPKRGWVMLPEKDQ